MGDYFTAGDRIPFDSCDGSYIRASTLRDYPIVLDRMLELSKDITDRLNSICVSRDVWIRIALLVCDARDDGVEQGIQKVLDDPAAYIEPERDEP